LHGRKEADLLLVDRPVADSRRALLLGNTTGRAGMAKDAAPEVDQHPPSPFGFGKGPFDVLLDDPQFVSSLVHDDPPDSKWVKDADPLRHPPEMEGGRREKASINIQSMVRSSGKYDFGFVCGGKAVSSKNFSS
jgi:hypothetical protein